MKVLLLFTPNLKIVNIQQNVIPTGLLYIGALLLNKGIDAEIINLANKSWGECEDIIREKKPDAVGISCYTFNRHSCIELAKIAKKVNSKIKVILGGPHASIMPIQLLENCTDIDIITVNEGEKTFLELIERLQNGNALENLQGIIYRNRDKITDNGLRPPLENLDELPIPASYFSYKRIITSRGCPGRCIFCDTPFLWGRNIRFRSAKNVVDELEILNKKYGISSFIISDDTFTFDKNRTIGICREIIKRNLKITWDCRTRVNFICEERLSWMKRAGCVLVSYGIESGSQKILNNLKKGIKVEQIKKAAELTRKLGFALNYFIIVGSPGETDDTIRETMNLIKDTKPTSVFVYIMQLTPGTEIYNITKGKGLINDSDWTSHNEETIFYTAEKNLSELNKYAFYVNEFFRVLKQGFQYSEKEINKIISDEKGVQDLINLAHIKMGNKKPDEAENIIDSAIELNPGSSEALMDKAILLAMKKDEKCIDFFDKAITADPENLLAYKNLGLFLFKQERCDEAINIFKKAIEIEPADVELYNDLGSIYGVAGNYDESINIINQALLIDPKNKETLRNLSISLDKKGAK